MNKEKVLRFFLPEDEVFLFSYGGDIVVTPPYPSRRKLAFKKALERMGYKVNPYMERDGEVYWEVTKD